MLAAIVLVDDALRANREGRVEDKLLDLRLHLTLLDADLERRIEEMMQQWAH